MGTWEHTLQPLHGRCNCLVRKGLGSEEKVERKRGMVGTSARAAG